MIFSISGATGSGKSTISKNLADILDYKHYSMGSVVGCVAKSYGVDLDTYLDMARKDPSIDRCIDDEVVKIGTQDNIVIESRTAFYFIPHSKKIFIDVKPRIAALRIYNDRFNPSRSDEIIGTLQQVYENIIHRTTTFRERIMESFGVDYLSKDNYDFVIDTSSIPKTKVFSEVYGFAKTCLKNLS